MNEQASALEASSIEDLRALATAAGLQRVGMIAWRDLDDPEAGGSELHAHEIARRWAAAGIDVVLRTSAVSGAPRQAKRDGYRVLRRSGRYTVFGSGPLDFVAGRLGPVGRLDGLVEIWNGMPFLSPLWWRGPRLVFLHHVHAEMWAMTLSSPRLAAAGAMLESRFAPPLYRRSRIVTLSDSSRDEIIESLHMRPDLVTVVAPGIAPRFSAGAAADAAPLAGSNAIAESAIGAKADHPLVVAVGRLVPVKQFDRLIQAARPLAELHPDLEIIIVGEGYERPVLEAAIESAGVGNLVRLAGRLGDEELVALYRRAWVLVSTSAREGWGMTVTEAAACGTPAVASRIAGHLDAVADDVTGLLFDNEDQFVKAVDRVLADSSLRAKLAAGALERAAGLTWDATALGTLEALADVPLARRRQGF
jgi:glycosyltransferase involved in cell wall biosynthesis